mmetsp:Transcript_28818/g.61249  ORF Transcript_28818/g.61249 Transcript_28818/m.61249 type:complete len:275 (+) Transcript_28818:1-825(+)
MRWCVSPSKRGFLRNPWNILDLSSVWALTLRVISYTMLDGEPVVAMLLLSVMPILRLLKALRNFSKLKLLFHALQISSGALTVPLFMLLVLVLVFSTLLYLFEDRESIQTMPHAIYLVVITLSTVGYGDTVPKTDLGRLICSLLAVCGVIYMAMPLSIVGNAFSETWRDRSLIILLGKMRQRLIQLGHTNEDLDEIFRTYDRDGSGTIDFAEFEDMMARLKLRLSARSVKELFHYFDRRGDGELSLEDFMNSLSLPATEQTTFCGISSYFGFSS